MATKTRKRPKPPTKVASAKTLAPKPSEHAAMDSQISRRSEQKLAPRMKVTNKNGDTKLSPDHPEGGLAQTLLMEAVGTSNPDFLEGILRQLANAASQGQDVDERQLNFLLAVVAGIEPRDQIEGMLAAQMAAIHMATMTFAHRLANVNNIPRQDSAERAFNKLARTFTSQMEALNRHRGKSQQKMTVKHVHVHDGGQAIVGSVQGGGGKEKNERQPYAKATDAPEYALRSKD
jgi:hypothetical protein